MSKTKCVLVTAIAAAGILMMAEPAMAGKEKVGKKAWEITGYGKTSQDAIKEAMAELNKSLSEEEMSGPLERIESSGSEQVSDSSLDIYKYVIRVKTAKEVITPRPVEEIIIPKGGIPTPTSDANKSAGEKTHKRSHHTGCTVS